MYTIFARMAPDAQLLNRDVFLEQEVARMRALGERLVSINPLFGTLGRTVPDMQRQIDEIVAEASVTDEGITPELSEELSRMAASGRVQLLEDTAGFAAAAARQVDVLLEDGSDLMQIEARTAGGDPDGKLSRTVSPDGSTVSLTMPMTHEEDYWFTDRAAMQTMLGAVVTLWDPMWASVYPSMYVGAQHNLFPDREAFGWMGYTAEQVTETGRALASVTPMGRGTFLLLQDGVMTLQPEDIESANKAEAFLTDIGILPLR